MKFSFVLAIVSGIATACAIIVLSRKGFAHGLARSDECHFEAKKVVSEIDSADGLQDMAETGSHSNKGMPQGEPNLFELERLGRVPDGADERIWHLCESTSWWGRRLDPAVFWSNRVVWLSFDVEADARSHGRLYPPLPLDETRFMDRSDKDKGGHPLRTWEIRCRAYYHSDRERVFWEWFSRSNPRPPDKIEQALGFAHAELMAIQSMCSSLSTDSTIPPSFQHDEEKVL